MKSNFDFLNPEWSTLASIGDFAEKNLYTDTNTTLIKLRILSENISKLILKEENLSEPESGSQVDRIKILKREDLIEFEIEQLFHSLRKIGNKATHEGYSPSFDDTNIYLSMSVKLSAWFKEVYGSDLTFKSEEVVYKKPEKFEFVSGYDQLKAENEKLIKDFKELKEANISARPKENKKIISIEAARKIVLDEKETRKLIDEQLRSVGWEADSESIRYSKGTRPQKGKNIAISEWPIGSKSVDYALFFGLEFVGLIEAKKKSLDVISVLEEAKMYSEKAIIIGEEKFVEKSPFGNYKIPFMFSTNGREYNQIIKEKSGIWFFDGRKNSNIPKPLRNWYSPQDLKDLLAQIDKSQANNNLEKEPFSYLEAKDGLSLKYYQVEAIKAVEEALIKNQKNILLTMATGTGKTRTAIGLVYRLIKSGMFKRILFVVDRSSLGKQANDSFDETKIMDGQYGDKTLTQIYDVKKIDDKNPEDKTILHFSTIQGLVRRIIYNNDNELKPSVGQYDCIIVDEAHRGYILDKEMDSEDINFKNQDDYLSKYKKVLDYFDAVKIGLTATPALHTVNIFGNPVYEYSYRKAVVDGNLVDYDPPIIFQTNLNTKGMSWNVGEEVAVYNRENNLVEKQILEDELKIEVESFNKKVITDDDNGNTFNRNIVKQLVQYLDPTLEEKTLIFTVTDEHADKIVRLLKEEYKELGYELDDNTIKKITGYLKKEQGEAIKRFKNEKLPNIVVTVDLLTTGIDIPKICNLVFIRRVKSRILYEQMIGRATRLCEEINKTHFKIYDCVGLYDSLKDFTDMKPVVQNPKQTFSDLVSNLKYIENSSKMEEERDEIIAKIQRKKSILKTQNQEDYFKIKSGNLTPEEYIEALRSLPVKDSIDKMLNDIELFVYLDSVQGLPKKQYISNHQDTLIDIVRGYGKENKRPEDYLESFKAFINENQEKILALTILKTSPSKITRNQLKELELKLSENDFSKTFLNSAIGELRNENIMADIITFIKNAVNNEPVINHEDKVKLAINKIRHTRTLTPLQKTWLDKIENHLLKEDIIQKEDFEKGAWKTNGGFSRFNKIFDEKLEDILDEINTTLCSLSA
ncbi:MAG: type I restriction-modification system endonuclease [Candidatus Sericytochromatia bacterium]